MAIVRITDLHAQAPNGNSHAPMRNKGGLIWGTMKSTENDDINIYGTLDYCIDYATKHDLEIINAQEVLWWLHRNVDFVSN